MTDIHGWDDERFEEVLEAESDIGKGKKVKPLNVYICKDNFIGRTCDECAFGYYGEHCKP